MKEQFELQKNRNEELEERLLHIVEKVETEKKQLANEIDTLTRKLEQLTSGGPSNGESHGQDGIDEPEDPSMNSSQCNSSVQLPRGSQQRVILGSRSASSGSDQTKGYHHFPVLGHDEGLIYGFRWEKGSIVKIV
ncbi:unnamed protein product [Cylicocyclus nassatus]|uniref:Uncharacterized protein n=1 Tax=Cylicocyclus nassatus TaxID=53992 RepID=A0AA36GFM8_CYLNA|nr:unnamed protein product [Cylicocyclus nassatus]